jgi:hypothetical protein
MYLLNPKVKEKVKKEIDIMLAVGLIFPMDEAEWISPIVIQSKKGIDDIRVYVDYRSLNSSCVHDPFPTPFSDEVLDQVVGNEAYSFTNGFFIIIKLGLWKKIRRRLPLLLSGVPFLIMSCPLG